MSDTTRERVLGLALQHAADLESLELLAELAPVEAEHSPDFDAHTRQLLAELADAHGAEEATEDPVGAWLDGALDAWVTAELDLDGSVRAVRDLVVLLSTGGPHVEVRHRHGDEVTVRVLWGLDDTERSVRAPHLAARLNELADMAEEATR